MDVFLLYSVGQIFLIMGLGQAHVNVNSRTENNNFESYSLQS